METIQWRDYLGNAIRYWEPARRDCGRTLCDGLPVSRTLLHFNTLLLLFVLAVLANVAYCAAYVPDVFAQMSSLRDTWLRFRWAVFVVGMAFAGVLTHFWSLGMFSQNAQ
jgi:hypothetical protein